MNILLIALTVILSTVSFAAGDGGHGSVTDLLYPLINFIFFIGILVWAVKPGMQRTFNTANQEVQEVMERANKKSQESALLLAEQEGKLENLDSEVEKLFASIDERVSVFEKAYEQETEEKISKLESDANNKIETERKQQIDKISGELLNQVIAQAKDKIKSGGQQEAVANRLVGEL